MSSSSQRPAPPIRLELGAAILVPAAVVSLIKVFAENSAIIPIIGASLASTVVAVASRRMRLPLIASAAVSVLGLVLLISWYAAPETTRFGFLPTFDTIEQIDLLANQLVVDFQNEKAPVPSLLPFIATAMAAVWAMAFLTDWGAMRLRLAFEPVLPASLLFVFSAALGDEGSAVRTAAVFATGVGLWGVAQRSVSVSENNDWLTQDRGRALSALSQVASVIVIVAIGLGAIFWPLLPGAEAEEIVSIGNQGEPTRKVVSPYVKLEQRLVEQTDVNLFTVTAERPSYWRLAGLDTFENNIWQVSANFSPGSGPLPDPDLEAGTREQVTQAVSVQALAAIWLPAAYTPVEVVDATANVTWNAESGSLTVANDIENSNGVDYTIVSSVPQFTKESLSAAPDTYPPELAEKYLALPELPPIVSETALAVAAGATSRYEQMLALQEYFRQFDYSTDLSPRQSDPITQFLTERVGFCQQFSGTFALMARSLGAPSRVAIGFTWGDPVRTTDSGETVYQVTGRHTHAWPEVWFEGHGWVAFEPTPGRGTPAGAGYLSVAAQQDSVVQPDNPFAPVTTTTAPPQAADQNAAIADPANQDFFEDPAPEGAASGRSTGPSIFTNKWLVAFLLVLVLSAVYGVAALLLPQRRRATRRAAVRTPADSVEVSWAEACEALERSLGIRRLPHETRHEFAGRIAGDGRVPKGELLDLAQLATIARYHPAKLDARSEVAARSMRDALETAADGRLSAVERWKKRLNPRFLIRPTSRPLTTGTPTPTSQRERPATTSTNGHHPQEDERHTLAPSGDRG